MRWGGQIYLHILVIIFPEVDFLNFETGEIRGAPVELVGSFASEDDLRILAVSSFPKTFNLLIVRAVLRSAGPSQMRTLLAFWYISNMNLT